ncbi:MAG: outer membrane beta-barrel protein [Candidatus Aminicenantes bacterium]|nr:outer membrane beta-barrel protein [Candidatus Aminicenantes bacterium]
MRAKGILLFCLTIIMFSALSHAEVFFIEAQGNYFQPKDQSFKDIYGNGKSFGGEIGVTLSKGISIWAGANYFSKKGKTTFTEEDTEIQIIPLYAGVRYRLAKTSIRPYVGLAVGYFRYKEVNQIGTVKKGDIGYIGQIGVIFKVGGALFLDIKGGYSYCKVKPVDIEANLGGLQVGIGLGLEL